MVKAKNTGVQVVMGPSGDAMLVLPLSKKQVAALATTDVSIALAEFRDLANLKHCLARYDLFRFKKDMVVRPMAEVTAGVGPVASRARRSTPR